MENPLVNPFDFCLTPANSSPLPNGISNQINDEDEDEDDDIEMIDLESKNYTSLKDLMPPSPPSTASPTSSSWKEIQIKDPLVQHAAWAYLQPMAAMPDENGRWWMGLKDKCCGMFGCFSDVVLVVFKDWCTEQRSDCGEDKVDSEV